MERREFLRLSALFGAGTILKVQEAAAAVTAATMPPDPEPVRAAHVEHFSRATTLRDVYMAPSHAEAARSIHEKLARDASGKAIEVVALDISPGNPERDQLTALKNLDVYSSSSSPDPTGWEKQLMTYKMDAIREYWAKSGTIAVEAAGNGGGMRQGFMAGEMSDMGDTVLTVGEVGKDAQGQWQVKDHSQWGNVTLMAPNITDNGFRIPIFNPTPSLEGHELLIEQHFLREDAAAQLQREHAPGTEITREMLVGKRQALEQDAAYMQSVKTRVAQCIQHPETLHQKMGAEIRAGWPHLAIDEKGYADHADGTSFASPYVAGLLTAAVAQNKERKASGKPTLTPEELVTVACLACVPVTKREGSDFTLTPVQNHRGLFYEKQTGFGMLLQEEFNKQLNEAYALLDKNPKLTSQAKTETHQGFAKQKISGEDNYILTIPPEQDCTIMKLRLEYKCTHTPLRLLELVNPEGKSHIVDMTEMINPKRSSDRIPNCSWGTYDLLLGESLAGTWKVIPYYTEEITDANRFNPTDLSLTVHGVEKGGLIDAMIDKKLGVESKKEITTPVPITKHRER